MSPEYPSHSPDAFMENATPVQSFVVTAVKVGPEELAYPRYGRPNRKPADQPEPPKPDDAPPDDGR